VSAALPRCLIAEGLGTPFTADNWFTTSTSFANSAATIARALTDTLAGIRPADVPGFVGAHVLGGISAALLVPWLTPAALVLPPANVPLVVR
jgi:hypothetical protein